jgi:hypothetical protein
MQRAGPQAPNRQPLAAIKMRKGIKRIAVWIKVRERESERRHFVHNRCNWGYRQSRSTPGIDSKCRTGNRQIATAQLAQFPPFIHDLLVKPTLRQFGGLCHNPTADVGSVVFWD